MALNSMLSGMSSHKPLTLLLLLLPVASTGWFYIRWRRLRHVPGPFWWSITPIPYLLVNLRGESHTAQDKLIRTYGPLVRIGLNDVLTTDYKHCQKMSATKSPYNKSSWYGAFRFQPDVEHSFSEMDPVKHIAIRTKIGPGYSATNLVEEAIDRQIIRLCSLIDRKYLPRKSNQQQEKQQGGAVGTPRQLDLADITQFLALDIVGDMSLGAPFGFLDDGEDIYDWVRWNEGYFPIASTCATLPFLAYVFQNWWPFTLALATRKDKIGLGRFIRVVEDSINERDNPEAAPKRDLMAQFLKHGLAKAEAASAALLQVVAGTDSVAVAIRMGILYVMSNTTVYNKLMAELDGAMASGQISRPVIKEAEAKRLPYLQAVIRESMRRFAPVLPLLSKTVPEGGDVVAGYHLPAGTHVGVHNSAVLSSKENWGEDAELFRPERWLEADEARLEEMSACLEAIFGYGRYKCVGRGVALMELNKAFPELLIRYNIAISNPTKPIEVMYSAVFWMMKGFWATLTPREPVHA